VKVAGAKVVKNPYGILTRKTSISSNSGSTKQSHEVSVQHGVFGYGDHTV